MEERVVQLEGSYAAEMAVGYGCARRIDAPWGFVLCGGSATEKDPGGNPGNLFCFHSNFLAEEAGSRELVFFIKQDPVELQGSIVVSEGLQESDPVLLEKFVRGSLKAVLYFHANCSGTVSIIARFLRTTEEVGRIYNLILPGIIQDGTVGEKNLR